MGWFDGWFGSGSSSSSDPLRRLDPKLREFLERESPVKYTTSSEQQPPQSQPEPQPPSQPQLQSQSQQTQQQSQQRQQRQPQQQQQHQQQQQTQQQHPAVPSESLFPDGRYAHLWKTYRPLSAIEAETKSDSEKLSDVLEAYKERRAQIGRAALENCAVEQSAWAECMRSGSWAARATMCRDEVRRFERCYAAQSRLLKALGYLSVQGRGADVDEDIQMRADELYHRMLAQEREIERAREEGREPPAFRPLFDQPDGDRPGGKGRAPAGAGAGAGAGSSPAAADLASPPSSSTAASKPGSGGAVDNALEPSPAMLAAWKEKLDKLPPEEREAEEKALRAEHRAKAEMAATIQGLWQEQAKEREARRAEGKETIMDKFSALVGSWSGPKSS